MEDLSKCLQIPGGAWQKPEAEYVASEAVDKDQGALVWEWGLGGLFSHHPMLVMVNILMPAG